MRFWTPAGAPEGRGPRMGPRQREAGCRSRRPQGARRARAPDGPASMQRQDAEADAEGRPKGAGPGWARVNQSFFSILAVFFMPSIYFWNFFCMRAFVT